MDHQEAPMKVLTAPWRLFTWLYENRPKETVGAILLIVVLSAAASGYANVALGQSNARNAVTSCENANESREAARALWGYVADLSAANDPDASEAEFIADFRDYVNKVYQPRDCSDPSRKYPAPTPPTIPAAP
jgi:hypothetical protein